MLSPVEIETRLERILLKVQKPGRYVGGEYNSVVKDWQKASTRVALVFPDIYDIGVSNLGMQILYDQVNKRRDALAERAYAPWVDMEAEMRQAGIPLYSLESKRPLVTFDILGFSLPYETLYTNVINLLDLTGIPIRTADRDGSHPLVIAGGHACFNPEPMHAFIDAFAIGEGEQIIDDIIDSVEVFKRKEGTGDRKDLLRLLARIPGVYVPSLYEVRYNEDGTVAETVPLAAEAAPTVRKRMVPKLPPPPTRLIVPNVGIVHNRVAIEVMRGCTRGCRFCHAGMVTRPVRERSVAEVVAAAEQAIQSTGFEELALLSLSSSDYTPVLELVTAISEKFSGRHLAVSLPSLRIESVSVDLMEKLKDRRSSGFTLAPEAATERMRRIINKSISDEDILATAREIYARGWTNIKLYFMIGHPSETLEDVQAIADLCNRVLAEGRKALGGRAKVHAGVSTFIPKPHTPFQWVPCDTVEQIQAKQNLLKDQLRHKNIKLSWNDPQDTLLETWLARGDRRMAEVIQAAWQNGTRFDAWQDQCRFDAWLDAFAVCGLDPAFYTHRPRRMDEVFPWDHISTAVRKQHLHNDFLLSLEGETRPDCRDGCTACGILPAFAAERRAHPGEYWKCPPVSSPPKRTSIALQADQAGP
ncbi:MAG: TIGR03960 family B12-binding radical SAM protein [Chloroflexota bacterium]